jgi:uncharacterized protein YbbC (DUF1343 family)
VIEPTFEKHAGRRCGAVQIHVRERQIFNSYRTGLAVLVAAKKLHPREFAWRTEMYEYRDDVPAIDLLTGIPDVRRAIDDGADVDAVNAIAARGTEQFTAAAPAARIYA